VLARAGGQDESGNVRDFGMHFTKPGRPYKPQCENNKYVADMIAMRDVGEAVDVPFFLTSGTILGWSAISCVARVFAHRRYRECRVIP